MYSAVVKHLPQFWDNLLKLRRHKKLCYYITCVFQTPQINSSIFIITYTKVLLKECQTIY